MKKPVLIVSASAGEQPTLLEKSLNAMKSTDKKYKKQYKLKMYNNNKTGLPELYNKHLNEQTLKSHDVVLFVHDDVFIDDLACFDKLYSAMFTYGNDIVGLAGSSKATIKKPALWHLMSSREHHSGAVAHFSTGVGDDVMHMSSFGIYPRRCLVLDGLFLAVNLKRAVETEWQFNENFKFHHYDIASCLDANNKRLKMTTWNIHVAHSSPGLDNYQDESFQQSEKLFIDLYT